MPAGVRGFISFHIAEQYFTICVSKLFHIGAADISLFVPSAAVNSCKQRHFCVKQIEKFTKLYYNNLDNSRFSEQARTVCLVFDRKSEIYLRFL